MDDTPDMKEVSLGDVDLASPTHHHHHQQQQQQQQQHQQQQQLENDDGQEQVSRRPSKSVQQYAAELDWKPGAAGFVSAANGIARIVRSLMVSGERIHLILGAVYQGERDHNKTILRTLKKFKINKQQAHTNTSGNKQQTGSDEKKKAGAAAAAGGGAAAAAAGGGCGDGCAGGGCHPCHLVLLNSPPVQ